MWIFFQEQRDCQTIGHFFGLIPLTTCYDTLATALGSTICPVDMVKVDKDKTLISLANSPRLFATKYIPALRVEPQDGQNQGTFLDMVSCKTKRSLRIYPIDTIDALINMVPCGAVLPVMVDPRAIKSITQKRIEADSAILVSSRILVKIIKSMGPYVPKLTEDNEVKILKLTPEEITFLGPTQFIIYLHKQYDKLREHMAKAWVRTDGLPEN